MTPEGWTVTAWATILAFAAIAAPAFYWSFRAAAPEKAALLRTIGFTCIGIAIIVFAVKKLIAMFLDS
jgi:hypothetical protein